MKAFEPGWIQVAGDDPSGRRGLWYRAHTRGDGAVSRLELCWGREGDDGYLDLRGEAVLSPRDLTELYDALLTNVEYFASRKDPDEKD